MIGHGRSEGLVLRGVVAVLLACFLGGMLTGCGSVGKPSSPQTVTLAMGFIPNVQFAPFYVAVEKGYFAEEGIQIQFDYGWETDLLKLVGSDQLQFAIASGDQVILAHSQGLPVVYILNWYRRFPVCVVSLAEKGIERPADLIGRRVGTPATYGASYIGWRALLDAAGLDETAIQLVSIGYTQVAALSEGQVDAAICYAMNEPVQLETAGYSLNILYIADYANLVSNGLITNEQTIRDRPDLVQGMVRATLRGLAYTLDHPEEAFQICLKQVPEAASDAQTEAVNRAILLKSIEFWKAEPGELGRSYERDWQEAQRIMTEMGLVSPGADVADMFSNRFIVLVEP
ncbi:MAG: ABC transporter substrate-binding protein [Anaerolineae bacterium]